MVDDPKPIQKKLPPPPPPQEEEDTLSIEHGVKEVKPPPPPPPQEEEQEEPKVDGIIDLWKSMFRDVKKDIQTKATPEQAAKNRANAWEFLPEGAKNAVVRGHKQAMVAEYLQPTSLKGFDPTKAPEIAQLQKELATIPVNPAFQAFAESNNPSEAAKAFASDPTGVMQDLFLTSATSMLDYGASRIALGAAMGAAGGSVIPVAGTAGGAAAGATVGMAATSLALEYSGSIIEQLQQEGVDVTDAAQLQAAFDDEEMMSRLRSHANKKSIPIAMLDLVTDGLAGKIIGKPAKTVIGKVGKYAGELGLQGAGGAGGEVLGSVVSGEDVKFGAALSEFAGEVVGAPVNIALGTVSNAQAVVKAGNIVNEAADTGNPFINAIIDDEANTAAQGTAVQTKPPAPPPPEETTTTTTNETEEQTTVPPTGETKQETPSETISEEEKVRQENEYQEKFKAKRKTLQDKVNQLYTEWFDSGEEAMSEELLQAKRNLETLDTLGKERDTRVADEKKDPGNQNPGNSPETPVTPKVSSNPRYKAQKKIVDDAFNAVLVDGQYDMTKLEAARNEAEKLNEIAKDLMRKQQVAEERAASPTVTTTIAKLRDDFYKHMAQGARLGNKALKELLEKVTDTAKEHKLTAKQVRSLVLAVRSTNLNRKASLDKFHAKVEKIANDADYAEQLDTAEELRAKVKKATGGKTAEGVHKAAKLFANIDPSELGTNLGLYIAHAHDIVNHYKSPRSESYDPANASKIQIFADKVNADQRQDRINEVRDELGFDDEDEVSDQDILNYLTSEEQGLSQEDPFAENKSETKRKIIRDKLQKKAEYSRLGLEEKDVQGKYKSKVDLIIGMDLSKLSPPQLVDYIRTVDNIVINDDYAGTDRLAIRAKVIENAAELRELLKGLDLANVNKFKQAVYSLPQIFKLIYTTSKTAAEAYRLSGLDGYFNSTARVENQEDKQNDVFLKKFKELKKKHKDFDKARTQVDASIFGTLVRYPKGTDPVEALAVSKHNIEESIRRLENTEGHEAIAADAKASYEKFKNAQTIEEVFAIMEKESKGAFEMWEFWRDSFKNEIMERLKNVSVEFHNSDFVEEENYTPKKFITLDSNIPKGGESTGRQAASSIGGRKQSVTAMAATAHLRPKDAIDFNFYDNMFKGWRESLYDIETTRPQQMLHEFLALPESADLLGGQENRKGLMDTWKKSDDVAKSFGGTTGNKFWNEATSTLKLLSNIKALGGIYQYPKQYLSVATSALFNLGTDAGLFFSVRIPEGSDRLFDQYTIGNRGKRLGGAERGESRNHHLQSAYASNWLKAAGAVRGFSEKGAHAFLYSLRKGDVDVAKRSWAAYYLQSLKDSGIDIKNISLADEANLQDQVVRQKAAAFAEQKVKETQLTANPEEQAMGLKTKAGAETAMKNILIPFSSFAINSKIRVMEAFNQLRKNPGSTEAWRELGAIASEIAVYNGVKTYLLGMITSTLLKPAIESLFDVKGESESDREKRKKRNQKFWSDVFKDAMPSTIGSSGTSATVAFFNYMHYLAKDPHMTYKKWEEKKKELITNYEKEGMDYGLYGVYIDAAASTAADTKMVYSIMRNRPIYLQNQWGNDEHVRLTPKEERFMKWNMMFEYAGDVGMMDADFFNTFQKTKRELVKRGKKRAKEKDAELGIEPPE